MALDCANYDRRDGQESGELTCSTRTCDGDGDGIGVGVGVGVGHRSASGAWTTDCGAAASGRVRSGRAWSRRALVSRCMCVCVCVASRVAALQSDLKWSTTYVTRMNPGPSTCFG